MSWNDHFAQTSSECLAHLKNMNKIERKHNKSTKFIHFQWATSHSAMSPKWESFNNDSPPSSSQLRRPDRKRRFCYLGRVLQRVFFFLWIKFVFFFRFQRRSGQDNVEELGFGRCGSMATGGESGVWQWKFQIQFHWQFTFKASRHQTRRQLSELSLFYSMSSQKRGNQRLHNLQFSSDTLPAL